MKSSITFESIGFRDIKEAKNEISDDLVPLVEKFYKTDSKNLPYYLTVRSSIVQVSSKGRFDNSEYFGDSIKILFNYNEISTIDFNLNKTTLKDYMCLGQLIGENWDCASRNVTNILNREDSPSRFPMIEYELPGPGTFAVIFKPRPVRINKKSKIFFILENFFIVIYSLSYNLDCRSDIKKPTLWSPLQKPKINYSRNFHSTSSLFGNSLLPL